MNVTEEPTVAVWLTGCVVKTGALAAGLTVRMAPLLVAEPAELVATTVYVPASVEATLAMVYEALVAPPMLVPFFRHWKVGVGEPLAATVKVTEVPAVTVWLTGCIVITGALTAVVTTSVAPALVMEPAEFEATTV